MDIPRELFEAQRHRRFGSANPERMQLELWERMARGPVSGPLYDFRRRHGLDLGREAGPDWCFNRYGQTRTETADGRRVVCVGGEYEDWYDPDFCIYNDVVVLGPGDEVAIFGYPRDVFPPTDFHTATLVGGRIILVGCLGYPEERDPDRTPVFSLDLDSYRIDRMETRGQPPGWIFEHHAEFHLGRRTITVWGGKILVVRDGVQYLGQNVDKYRLHLGDGRWERRTDRGWRQFVIVPEDRRIWSRGLVRFGAEALRPGRVPHQPLADLDLYGRLHQFSVEGVVVRVAEEFSSVRLLVRGRLAGELVQRIVGDIFETISAAVGRPCRLVEF